jgi:hypothetical protein
MVGGDAVAPQRLRQRGGEIAIVLDKQQAHGAGPIRS